MRVPRGSSPSATCATSLRCSALSARLAERLGPIRVLVNNAANDHRDAVAVTDQAVWDDRIAVNVRHHFFAAQAVARMMRDAGGGSIINLGSISAQIPASPTLPAMSPPRPASKG